MINCWDNPLLIFWGHLPFEVVFIWSILVWSPKLSLSLKFEEDPISGCWDIPLLIFWGHLPFKVVFHWRSSSFEAFFIWAWSPKLKFKIWGRSDQWLLRYSNFKFGTFIFSQTHTQTLRHLRERKSKLI